MYQPTRSELLELGFFPKAEGHQIKWLKEISPINRDCRFFVYREEYNTWGYGRLRFSISNQEEILTLIKTLSKKKAIK